MAAVRPTVVKLKKGEEDRLLAGHLWVYDNEVDSVETDSYDIIPGETVEVVSSRGRFLGRGYINPRSKILVRLMTRDANEAVDRALLQKRITAAWEYRRSLGPEFENSCRVVFGEADMIPALIVDKYADVLSIQTLALGIDIMKDDICGILEDIFHPSCIYERNDVPVRRKEGLEEKKGPLRGELHGEVRIRENGVDMLVDVENGQKTGYFLDQKENRAALARYCRGRRVLDTFSHTGGFALNAARGGASEVAAVDVSRHATDFIRKNAELNGFSNIKTVTGDVFEKLVEYSAAGEKFDVIILDPPAFCKTRSALEGAYRGYKEINLRAMRLLTPGGILMSCSCSHYMYPEIFMDMLRDAAADSGRDVRVLENRIQSRDHPYILNSDESCYLKCVVLEAK